MHLTKQVRRWSHRLNSVARLAEPAAGLALAAGAGPAGQAGGEPIGKSIPPGRRAIFCLTAARSEMVAREALTAAERAGVDQFWVLRGLRRNATLAARRGDSAASNRAIELIGKHFGMFIDRKQVEVSYIDDADEYLAKIMAIVDAKTVEHEPAPLPIDYEMAEDE